ncbi:hypothetical protein [Cellulomonas sp.]|uniref:hypothetical protein n=1 Tax=Cellulomonas sp. TaxID=40001 RepID=UPI00258C1732|nr:hypothetical protein [Cellulomonas sp.]MCR6689386.1 hypothetical protein [Cellulomonas sp.]
MPRATTIVGIGLVAATAAAVAVGWQAGHPGAGSSAPLAHESLPAPVVTLTRDFSVPAGTCPAYSTHVPVDMDTGWQGSTNASGMLAPGNGLMLTCFGSVAQVGHLDDLVDDRRAHGVEDYELIGAPVVVTSPLGESVRFDYAVGLHVITEWVVEREGAVFAVGYLHDGTASHLAEVQAVMAGWRWG